MKLLNIEINPFLRTIWVSQRAKEVWQSVIQDLSQFVSELEIMSVAKGQRKAGWQSINIQQLPSFEKRCAELGLTTLVVRYSQGFQGFAHKFQPANDIDNNTNVPVIFAQNLKDALDYRNAYEAGNHDAQGKFLDFPLCCRRFFDDVWTQGYYDPVWQSALNSKIVNREDNKLRIKSHPYSNPILRYIGLRVGFHIPCSFQCEETIRIAEKRIELARQIDLEKTKLLEALLSMPMSWNCLKGIAMVRTPIFYVITSSVPCAERHFIEIEGDFIPREFIRGLVFPFIEVRNGQER